MQSSLPQPQAHTATQLLYYGNKLDRFRGGSAVTSAAASLSEGDGESDSAAFGGAGAPAGSTSFTVGSYTNTVPAFIVAN